MTAHRRRIARTSAAAFAAALVVTLGLSPAIAGAQTERIIGGGAASGASWPSIVHLEMHFTENGSNWTSSCGGTLVAPHWVLTAAHCTFGEASTLVASNFTVVSGRTNLTQTATGESIGVTEIVRHPGYNPSGGLRNDLALLHLSSAASAPPMELAVQANVGSYTEGGGAPNTAGWGYTIPGDSTSGSTVLKETYAPLRTNSDCAAALSPVATFDASTMVCAGAAQFNGTTTCHGDSGGPLVVFNGGRKVLWGVVNWGKPDCSGGVSAFARVAAFEGFLKPVFDELSPPTTTVAPPPAEPVTAPPAPAPAPITVSSTQTVDITAPRLDRFVIPAIIRVRGGRPTRSITIRLRCSERATVRISLQRRSGATFTQLSRAYLVKVGKGTSRMTLPRSIWRMTPGAYRLRFTVTDETGNTRTYHAAIRVRRG